MGEATSDAVEQSSASSTETDPTDGAPSGEAMAGVDTELLIQEGDIAGDYIERLLDILDADGDIDLDVDNDRAVVAVIGERLSSLIGPHGATLDALQDLTRLAVAQQTGTRSRLMLDIGGFRARRREELETVATRTAEEVRREGKPVRLEPMNPFERKIVHDVISATTDLVSESEGDEPQRRVVVLPRDN